METSGQKNWAKNLDKTKYFPKLTIEDNGQKWAFLFLFDFFNVQSSLLCTRITYFPLLWDTTTFESLFPRA